jgi:hypothetical protein
VVYHTDPLTLMNVINLTDAMNSKDINQIKIPVFHFIASVTGSSQTFHMRTMCILCAWLQLNLYFMKLLLKIGAWGRVVVKALHYK